MIYIFKKNFYNKLPVNNRTTQTIANVVENVDKAKTIPILAINL